jgi:hypothetical protein
MLNVANPMVDMYQTQLEASRRFADVLFSGTERIDRVVLEAAHRAFTDQLKFAQAVMSARDPQSVANAQSSYFSHRPDNAVNSQKEIMRIFAEIQNEIGRSMQFYVEQLGSSVATNTSAPFQATQERANGAAFNPMTGMFSVWESAFREVASMANRNMAAARTTFENAASTATEASKLASNVGGSAASSAANAMSSASSNVSNAVGGNGSRAGNTGSAGSPESPDVSGGSEQFEERKPTHSPSRRK